MMETLLMLALYASVSFLSEASVSAPSACCPPEPRYTFSGEEVITIKTPFTYYGCPGKYAFVKGDKRWIYNGAKVNEITTVRDLTGNIIDYTCETIADSLDALNEGNLHHFHQCVPGDWVPQTTTIIDEYTNKVKYSMDDLWGRGETRLVLEEMAENEGYTCTPTRAAYNLDGKRYTHNYKNYDESYSDDFCDDDIFKLPTGVACNTPVK